MLEVGILNRKHHAFIFSLIKVEVLRHRFLNLDKLLNLLTQHLSLKSLEFNIKVLFFLEEIEEIDVEGLDMILVDFELCVLLLDLELWFAVENVGVVGQSVAFELEDELLFLVDVLGLKADLDLLFLLGLEEVHRAGWVGCGVGLDPVAWLLRYILSIDKPPRLIGGVIMVYDHHFIHACILSSIDKVDVS